MEIQNKMEHASLVWEGLIEAGHENKVTRVGVEGTNVVQSRSIERKPV